MPHNRLLILGCTARKRADAELLPALARYEGPAFRVYRRFHASHPGADVCMYVLSAEYGLIPESSLVPLYDRSMSPARAAELQAGVRDVLSGVLSESAFAEALVCVGRRYRAALPDPPLLDSNRWQVVEGPPGVRLSKLYDWLYGSPPAAQTVPLTTAPVRVRGKEIALSREELLELARERLTQQTDAAGHWHSWYVLVGGARVAPKWLVSQATGLSVSAFSTDDARRVLTQLGIEVRRA